MHSGATLTEIAYHNGFVNETAMIRAFRKYRGMTPSEYRNRADHT
jgi:xylan 1,4-beta-xylosidase